MIRLWAAIALLAVSWLPGLGYYHRADWPLWALLAGGGVLLLLGSTPRTPVRWMSWVAILLLVPAILFWSWPYRLAPALLASGLALVALPIPRIWPRRVGGAAVVAGIVLLAQAVALWGYEALTARSHELPWPLTLLVGTVTHLLGQDSAVCGSTLAMHSMRVVHLMGATWELLLDGPTLCFLAGGIGALLMQRGWRSSLRPGGALLLIVLAWLPVRVGVLVSLYMHRALVTDYDEPLNLMNQFWSTPLLLALLAGPALMAWRFVAVGAPAPTGVPASGPSRGGWRRAAAVAAFGAAVAVLTCALLWEPAGQRKAGRVFVDEFHSTWEPTGRPMDTAWYGHESGYNYACMYDYCSRFYEMSRLKNPIGDGTLNGCDVLIVKAPTSAYKEEEIEAICRFVKRGGGLVLIGEHTDVFHVGEHLNAVSRRFGFEFVYDCLFGIDSFFEQLYEPPLVPHPVIQYLPPLDFAVSCSIAPGRSWGRAVMRATGLKSAPADYHASNFYPQAQDRPDMRYGAFVQLWAARYGKGRIVAFTDSTQFSNFSMFEPGKPQLILGMLEWCNRTDSLGNVSPLLLTVIGLALGALALVLARGWAGAWAGLVAVGMLAHVAAAWGVREENCRAMPPPENIRPYVLVTTDRTVSDVILPKGGFIAGKEDGFGCFERWILRVGYFTERASGADVTRGQLAVIINPDLRDPDEYLDTLVRYVEQGGKLLVLDSAKNLKSTANSVLWPFGLTVRHDGAPLAGSLAGPQGWPTIKVDAACEISGGESFARIQGRPVGTWVRRGKGLVTVIGFSSRFSDANMGVTGDTIPDAAMRDVYETQFKLFRAIIEDTLPTLPPPAPAAVPSGGPPSAPPVPPKYSIRLILQAFTPLV